jgi:hypothetical protein
VPVGDQRLLAAGQSNQRLGLSASLRLAGD